MSERMVLDASFVASVLFEEEHSAFASRVLRERVLTDRTAPDLLPWEISNILRTHRRRGLLSAEQSGRAIDVYLGLEIRLSASPDKESLRDVGDLADRFSLSAYDAAYLKLALRGGDRLATLDRKLTHAATSAGLPVSSPFT